MARWFDDAAKKAAHGAGDDLTPAAGFSRRTALKRGAVVAGVAWTAPMLMQTRAYAGASACGSGTFVCQGTQTLNPTVVCCSSGNGQLLSADICTTSLAGVPSCVPPSAPGGYCGNSGNGQGQCDISRCNGDANQCNGCAVPHICGGESAHCGGTILCGAGLTCTPDGSSSNANHCRLACTSDSQCSGSQVCDSTHFCAQLCGTVAVAGKTTRSTICQAGETCAQDGAHAYSICSYNQA